MNTTTLLAILQQSEYDLQILKRWEQAHRHDTDSIEPEKWTSKLKLIKQISQLFFFLPPISRIQLALLILSPTEFLIRQYLYHKAKSKLTFLRKHGLQVIAIAGSYAKTSTKNILTHALSKKNEVLATPQSINTLLGISEVIKTQLTDQHTLFIVEFGEYHPQDIPMLTQFVEPDLGILTPIGRQHLEIIGGFENLVQSFTHFIGFFKDQSNLLIHELNQDHFPEFQGTFYGISDDSQLQVKNALVSRAGTEYMVEEKMDRSTQKVFIPLFGEHQAVNTLTAIWAAHKLNKDVTQVIKRLHTLPYISRRHEPRFAEHNVLILDNSYNTNPDSVQESLKLINQLQATKRFIITVGFTELGEESNSIHFEYGKELAKNVDFVGLIKAPWSDRIVDGFTSTGGARDHIFIADSQEKAFTMLQAHVVPGSVILFEGGYREVYV